MLDPISYPGLAVALVLPWVLGTLCSRLLLGSSGRWHWLSLIGYGYFLGIYITTILLRLGNGVGLELHFVATVIAISLMILACIGLLLKRPKVKRQALVNKKLEHWHLAVIATLMVLLAWRYHTLLQELLLRPLYAWDAWMNWAPKAIVWFHLGELVDFVAPEKWLELAPDANAYTLGNRVASEYPPTIPLILLWSMLGGQTWDHSALYLPWFLAALNLGLVMFGQLRLSGCQILPAVLACYLLLNLPYFNVHTVLAGYADVWLAATFGLAIFALREWWLHGSHGYCILFLVMALMCSQLKLPGIVLTLILIATFLRCLLNMDSKWEFLAVALCLLTVVALALFGLDIQVPVMGHLLISTELIKIPGIGEYELHYHPVWGSFAESMFIMINWNIGWYLAAAIGLLVLAYRRKISSPSPEAMALLGAFIFLVFTFIFTKYYKVAENFVTLNRAMLYVIPAFTFYISVRLSGVNNQTEDSSIKHR